MKRTLTPTGFSLAVNTHLDSTNLGMVLTSIKLTTDSAGNLEGFVIENLRKTLRVAGRMAPDASTTAKCEAMLTFLEDY